MSELKTSDQKQLTPWRMALSMAWRMPLFVGLLVGIVGLAAGRWDLWNVWAYAFVFVVGMSAGVVVVSRTDPTLFQERMKPGPGGKDPGLRWWTTALFVLQWVMAGLDAGRFRWSGGVPAWIIVAGLVLLAGSLGLSIWAMSVNRFFSSDARIQRDRGHRVVTSGPYQLVRHPGYAAALVMGVASGLALASYVSLLPMLLAGGLIVRRLLIEDRLLLGELEGYSDYAARVPYRLVPGIW